MVLIIVLSKKFPKINCFDSWEECSKGTDAIVIMTEWNIFRGLDLKKLYSFMIIPINYINLLNQLI